MRFATIVVLAALVGCNPPAEKGASAVPGEITPSGPVVMYGYNWVFFALHKPPDRIGRPFLLSLTRPESRLDQLHTVESGSSRAGLGGRRANRRRRFEKYQCGGVPKGVDR